MNIRSVTVMIAAFFAVSATCFGILAPTSSYYMDDDDTSQTSDKPNTIMDDDETDDQELEDVFDFSSLKAGDLLSFSLEDDFPEEFNGYEVLDEFLPNGVELEWTGKKLKVPKAGKIKYSKKDEDFIDKKDSDNPAGLKIKINKKKNTVSGSFKIYVAKSEKKLKSYTAKFSGRLGGSLNVTVKKTVVATAIIEYEGENYEDEDEDDE